MALVHVSGYVVALACVRGKDVTPTHVGGYTVVLIDASIWTGGSGFYDLVGDSNDNQRTTATVLLKNRARSTPYFQSNGVRAKASVLPRVGEISESIALDGG